MDIEMVNNDRLKDVAFRDGIVRFLHTQLGKYADPIEDINKAMEYAVDGCRGGSVYLAIEGGETLGALLTNNTGMSGYIPANVIVYVAVKEGQRGRGIGRRLIERAIKDSDGDISLHVEHDNPAKRLYERLGFSSKYLEMRYTKV